MPQRSISANEREENLEVEERPKAQKRSTQSTTLQNFTHWTRSEQLQVFFVWLPQELHDAPGIQWEELSSEIMCYCVKTIKCSPDAAVLAVVAASIHGAMDIGSQRATLKEVTILLRDLRATLHIQCLADLKREQIWHEWAAQKKPENAEWARQLLSGYTSVTNGHFPRYLLRLDLSDRQRMQQYALPLLPADLKERYFSTKQLLAKQQAKRKATTDILTPLYPILRQLILLRKQLAERVLFAIREARRRVETGEAILPYHFQHTDIIPEMNRDARTVADIRILGREVTLKLVLWDKRTWVEHHSDRYCDESVRYAEEGLYAYTPKQNCFFIQLMSPSSDFLWFGDLVQHRLFQKFGPDGLHQEGYQERWQYVRQFGFSNGCACQRPGLLSPGNRWFFVATERGDELLVEFESLYRGILYGSALAMLALSNGSRMSELLQVSWNKERRVTRTETVVLLDADGQPQMESDGKPKTKQVKLHFQYLLTKGAKTEEDRQLFPLSKEAMRLLGEIKTLLEKTYGEFPVVAPSRSNIKREHLKPERYLFQWEATADRELGAIGTKDAQLLLRFMFHGLDLYTASGKPIRVSVHILRHVMATHARHHRHVPPEVIAHFFLHHRLKQLTGREPTLPEISEYYTLMTEEQRFAVISADLDEQEELDHALLQMAPTPRDLEQKNEDLRTVYELWHALHPTALGHCGCPGLCPRGTDRALCLGCGYHVEDPEKLGAALIWRASYEQQAKLFEAQGNAIDARQARIKIQQLDDMINIMRIQLKEEAAGHYIPLYKVLPSPHRKQEDQHEAED